MSTPHLTGHAHILVTRETHQSGRSGLKPHIIAAIVALIVLFVGSALRYRSYRRRLYRRPPALVARDRAQREGAGNAFGNFIRRKRTEGVTCPQPVLCEVGLAEPVCSAELGDIRPLGVASTEISPTDCMVDAYTIVLMPQPRLQLGMVARSGPRPQVCVGALRTLFSTSRLASLIADGKGSNDLDKESLW